MGQTIQTEERSGVASELMTGLPFCGVLWSLSFRDTIPHLVGTGSLAGKGTGGPLVQASAATAWQSAVWHQTKAKVPV